MTVIATDSRVQYDTNGTTGPFSIPFYFIADADIEVTYADADGAETPLTLTTDYALTGAGGFFGGTLTLVTAYAAGGTVTVRRVPQATQPTDYVDTDSLPAATLERSFDRATMIGQLALEEVSRAIKIPVSESTDVAVPSDRANKLIAFDADKDVTVTPFTSAQVVAAIEAYEAGGEFGSHVVRETIVAAEGDLTLTFADVVYTVGGSGLRVYEDGRLLERGSDYTETSTTSITLTTAADGGERFQIIAEMPNRTGEADAEVVGIALDERVASTLAEWAGRRELHTKDFGCVHDGSDDTTAFNAAIAACATLGVGTLVVDDGILGISAQITIETPIKLVGSGYGDAGTSASSAPADPRCQIKYIGSAQSSGSCMLHFIGETSGDWFWNGGIDGIYVNGNNLASTGVRLSSTRMFQLGDLYVRACTDIGLLIDDGNATAGANAYTNIGHYHYGSGNNAAAANSRGLVIRETDNRYGVTGIHAHAISCFTVDGNAIEIGQSDNGVFLWMTGNASGAAGYQVAPYGLLFRGLTDAGGTGGVQERESRKNFIFEFSGTCIKAEAGSKNVIQWINGEGTSAVIEDDAVLWYGMLDRRTGKPFQSEAYLAADRRSLQLADGIAINGTAPSFSAGTATRALVGASGVSGVLLDDGSGGVDEGWNWSFRIPRDWNDGRILGVEVLYYNVGGGAGNIRLQSRAIARPIANGVAGTYTTKLVTEAAPASTVTQLVEILFDAPVYTGNDTHEGTLLSIGLQRLAFSDVLDTLAGDVAILDFRVIFQSDVGDGDGAEDYRYDATPLIANIT